MAEINLGLGTNGGFSITPSLTGIVKVTLTAVVTTNLADYSTTINGRYGNGGAPPLFGTAPVVGTAFSTKTLAITVAAGGRYFLKMTATVLGLTVNRTYWFDLSIDDNLQLHGLTIENIQLGLMEVQDA